MAIEIVAGDCVRRKEILAGGVRLSVVEDGKEVGHAYLYVMRNDLHRQPFGLMEDVFIEEAFRSKGYGTRILEVLFAEARRRGCYKLIGTSRFERPLVHQLYERLGFRRQGVEFRMDFPVA